MMKHDENVSAERLREVFLKEKPAHATVALKRSGSMHVRGVAERIDSSYSHTVKMMDMLERNGIVESERAGRKKMYDLTGKGEKLAENLYGFFDPDGNAQRKKPVSELLSDSSRAERSSLP